MLVPDASVLIKFLIADPLREADSEKATALLTAVAEGRREVILPPHWLAEIAAVLCRLSPATALEDVEALRLLEWPVADGPQIYRRAAELAIELDHHLFDTLYHAVALESGATLVTADRAYWRKARRLGQIVALGECRLS